MKKILIGTTNPSKVRKFQELLEGYDVEFMTLTDIGVTAEPSETGRSPRENAEIKARFYGQFAGKTEQNYTEIDAISGATLTTNGYKQAIERAFAAIKVLNGGAR